VVSRGPVAGAARERRGPGVSPQKPYDALVTLQHPQGWWKGELETNVTMDAEDLLLREFLGIARPS